MKNILLSLFFLMAAFACNSNDTLERRDRVMLDRRDFILSDTSIRVKPVFIPLPAGSVHPQGWIKDWATAAAGGITGHLDEWSPTFGMAWKGVGFKARGANPQTGTGWPLEQCSYWLDGAVRLAYLLNDSALIRKVTDRLDLVVNGVLNGGKSFVYWQDDLDFKNSSFNNWAHSHMGRALVAWYEATGDARILEALVRVYSRFDVQPVPWNINAVSGCTNIDPMLAVYKLSGNRDVLNAVLRIAGDSVTAETVRRWNLNDFNSAHGVITYENLRIPAMMYPVTGQRPLLQASQNFLEWIDRNHLLPYDIASSEEHVAGIGATRNTETCNVACSGWTYQQLLEITGDGQWGDRIEKVFFNAGPAPVDRHFQTMAYYQSPNRIEELMPSEMPVNPGEGAYTFKNTGHDVLCCVGNLNRVIPNYVMHMWTGTADRGLAATLYGPCTVRTAVGNGIPVEITSDTDYPFEETVRMTLRPAQACTFPLHLRIPSWCRNPEARVNGEPVNMEDHTDGFVTINRKWTKGDRVDLYFPMHVEVRDGRETPYPCEDYFRKGGNAHRVLPQKTDINSPYRTVSCGPLLFALAVKDLTPNRQDPDAKWNYALVSGNGDDVRIERSGMPSPWSWQPEDVPVRLTLKAGTFDWQPTPLLPLPEDEVSIDETVDLTLIPYGCTKFRICMFPVAK